MPELPERLLSKGRPVDPVFDPEEYLYRRLRALDIDPDGRIEPTSLESPDFSVNRSKYCEPEDVILPHPSCGIASFTVVDIPESFRSVENIEYRFSIEHDPLEDNYAHSEIRSYKDGQRLAPKKPPKSIRTRFRLALASRMDILRSPRP